MYKFILKNINHTEKKMIQNFPLDEGARDYLLKNHIPYNAGLLSKEIYQIALKDKPRKKYLNLLKQFAFKKNSLFFCHPAFDRNEFCNKLFYNICLNEFLNKQDTDVFLYTDNLITYARLNFIFNLSIFYFFIYLILILFNQFKLIIKSVVVFFKILLIYQSKMFLKNNEQIKYVVFTFIDKSIIHNKDKFIDRYFPNLFNISGINKENYLIIAACTGDKLTKADKFNFKSLCPNSLLVEDLVSSKDFIKLLIEYVFVFFYTLFKISGIDPKKQRESIILLEDISLHMPHIILCGNGIIKGLLKRNIQPKIFINSFENLSYEKRIIKAIRKYLPSCTSVAYQHAMFLDNLLQTPPLMEEYNSKLLPDRFITNGKKYFETLKTQDIYQQVDLRLGPTLRYKNYSETIIDLNLNSILFLGSISEKETINALLRILESLKSITNTSSILIKLHPSTPIKSFYSKIKKMNINEKSIVLCDKSATIEKLAQAVKFVLTCSPGSVLDILCLGKIPYFIAPEFSMTMVPYIDDQLKSLINVIFDQSDILHSFQLNNSKLEDIKNFYTEFYTTISAKSMIDIFFTERKKT